MTDNNKNLFKYDIIDIKLKDFVKYLKCIYLVKSFYRADNGYYTFEYYFRTSRNTNAKLRTNDSYKISGYLAEKIKKASAEETQFLISRIKTENPEFDMSFAGIVTNGGKQDKDVNDCITFLKGKGYLIYQPM